MGEDESTGKSEEEHEIERTSDTASSLMDVEAGLESFDGYDDTEDLLQSYESENVIEESHDIQSLDEDGTLVGSEHDADSENPIDEGTSAELEKSDYEEFLSEVASADSPVDPHKDNEHTSAGVQCSQQHDGSDVGKRRSRWISVGYHWPWLLVLGLLGPFFFWYY